MAELKINAALLRDLKDWDRFCEEVQASNSVNLKETKAEQNARKKRALKDYNFFVKTYFSIYADADCALFQIIFAKAVLNDENIMAVAEWAREHAKSVHCDILIPMWLLIHDQLTGMLLMGKNQEDACNLLADLQAQLQFNTLFAHDWGDQYNYGDWREGDFTTKNGIRFKAYGRDQSPRGARKGEKRPNYAVVDDVDDDELVLNPLRVKKIVNTILGALLFALSIKGSRLIVAGNRIHSNSVLANIVGDVRPGQPKRIDVYHSKVCAIENDKPAWPERYTLEEIQRKINKAGPTLARREFFHENHVAGTIFKDEHLHWRKIPPLKKYIAIIGYLDPSFENTPKSDYKAVRVWGLLKNGEYEYHCLKSFVRRCPLTDPFLWMIRYESTLPKGVGIIWYCEKQFINSVVRRAIRQAEKTAKRKLNILMDTTDKDNKYTRMVKMEPEYYNGQVFYNLDEIHNPDMIEGNNQLKGIEPGYKGADDAPDADQGAWNLLSKFMTYDDNTPTITIGQREHEGSW